MTAIFKPVAGWPEYEISEFGEIKRTQAGIGTKVGKVLKWTVMTNGYAKVSLCRNSKRAEYLVHRLVALTFIGAIPKDKEVCHYDGNKLNNSLSNLRIDGRLGNMADQIRHGKTPRGQRCGSNKYTPEQILKARELRASGMRNMDVAAALGMRPQHVTNIVARRIWAWL